MASTIKLKNGSGAPLASDLVAGEPALDLTNKRLYTEDSGGTVIEVGTNPSTITIPGGTIDNTVIGGTTTAAGSFTTLQADTSLNVDGTVTADGLTVGGNILRDVDTSSVVISGGTAAATGANVILYGSTSGNVNDILLRRNNVKFAAFDGATGDISFYEDTGTTAKFFWDSSNETLGIGSSDTAPSTSTTDLYIDSSVPMIELQDSDDSTYSRVYHSAGNFLIDVDRGNTGANSYFQVKLDDSSTDVMAFNTTGLGIGTSSPNGTLTARNGNTNTEQLILGNSSNTGGRDWRLGRDNVATGDFIIKYSDATNDNNTTEAMRIDSSGNVGIGVTPYSWGGAGVTALDIGTVGSFSGSASDIGVSENAYYNGSTWVYKTTSAASLYQQLAGSHRFSYAASGTAGASFSFSEAMRIDSSGNLLVGRTSTGSSAISGTEVHSDGYTQITRSAASTNPTLHVGKLTNDGEIVRFSKDGSSVGSIASVGGNVGIGNADTGIYFSASNDNIVPCDLSTSPPSNRDNAIDLGALTVRFDDIYATNGTIQTSDRNEKQDIEELSEAEQRVAVAAKSLMRKFRWIDSVEEKGDDARIHFGIIAQDLQAAFEAEGLDAGRYAMFISSTWTDEETGEERSRMGVRYSELLAFIIAAI